MLKFILNNLANLIYIISRKHKKIAKLNLDLAFKNTKTDKEKYKIIKNSYKSLIYNMYEFIDNQYASKNEIFSKAKEVNEHFVENAIKDNRKIIFMATHYGAWEQSVPYIALKYGTVGIVNRRMNNKYMNNEYIKARDKNNIIMIEKKEAAKGMIRTFKKGHFLAVAIDQNTAYGEDIEFFSQKTRATDSTARLAVKFDALIIPIFCIINDLGDYTIKYETPIDHRNIDNEKDKINILTQEQASVLEKQIVKEPNQWFWQHKRWKYHLKDLYDKL